MLGESRAAAGDREAAGKDFRAALAMRPDLRGVHFALGEMYLGSGDYGNAEREFREEAKLAPGFAPAAFKLGVVLLNRGEIGSAVAELQRANALQPDMPETLLELGKAAAAAGEVAMAEKLFHRVLDREQTSSLAESAHFQLSRIYRELGRLSDSDREMKLFQEIRNARK